MLFEWYMVFPLNFSQFLNEKIFILQKVYIDIENLFIAKIFIVYNSWENNRLLLYGQHIHDFSI
jgi:hypothetical protein